ncbi:hypothetical protein POP15_184 [Pectobacterium phage POP15]|nr:hypothetical protein POP15_184 [Pectobacterium phage POP15]
MTTITESELIQKLHDLGTDENGDITEEFLHFDAGTDIIEIWKWAEENYPGFSIVKVMAL